MSDNQYNPLGQEEVGLPDETGLEYMRRKHKDLQAAVLLQGHLNRNADRVRQLVLQDALTGPVAARLWEHFIPDDSENYARIYEVLAPPEEPA